MSSTTNFEEFESRLLQDLEIRQAYENLAKRALTQSQLDRPLQKYQGGFYFPT
jgi:hypothetical protein